jgi:hypothetical protein
LNLRPLGLQPAEESARCVRGHPRASRRPRHKSRRSHRTMRSVPRAVPRLLSVQPAMGDLVDAELPRPGRMPLSHREQEQSWL